MRTLEFPPAMEHRVLQVMTGKRQTASEIEFNLGVLGIEPRDINQMLANLRRRGCVDRTEYRPGRYKWFQTEYGSLLAQFINYHGESSDNTPG